jgi:hypothetical protein
MLCEMQPALAKTPTGALFTEQLAVQGFLRQLDGEEPSLGVVRDLEVG